MQTRDEVEGLYNSLHNCQKFSQHLECLCKLCKDKKKVFYCFNKITLGTIKTKLFVTVAD